MVDYTVLYPGNRFNSNVKQSRKTRIFITNIEQFITELLEIALVISIKRVSTVTISLWKTQKQLCAVKWDLKYSIRFVTSKSYKQLFACGLYDKGRNYRGS